MEEEMGSSRVIAQPTVAATPQAWATEPLAAFWKAYEIESRKHGHWEASQRAMNAAWLSGWRPSGLAAKVRDAI
jgi:hypothetical protein